MDNLNDLSIRSEFEIALQTELISVEEKNLKHIHNAITELKGFCSLYPNIVPNINKDFFEEMEALIGS
jgi:hypothetical protein